MFKPVKNTHYQKKELWKKFLDEIMELPEGLQNLLKEWFEHGFISEDAVIFQIDDLDTKAKTLERFLEVCDKLSIKVETIEEMLERERLRLQEESKQRLGKIKLYDSGHTINDKQYQDYIKLYFNELSKLPLLTFDEEKELCFPVSGVDIAGFSRTSREDGAGHWLDAVERDWL